MEQMETVLGRLSEIEDALAGTLYIYPSEWGDSYSVIEEGNNPVFF